MEKIILDFVKLPAGLREVKKRQLFVDMVVPDIERLNSADRKTMAFELVCYLASVAELYYSERGQGMLKKKSVLECLNGVDTLDNLERMLELALESGKVERITTYKRVKLYLKKKFLEIQPQRN